MTSNQCMLDFEPIFTKEGRAVHRFSPGSIKVAWRVSQGVVRRGMECQNGEEDRRSDTPNQGQRLACAELPLPHRCNLVDADSLVLPLDAAVAQPGDRNLMGFSVAGDNFQPIANLQQPARIDAPL